MKRLKKILKWTGVVLGGLAAIGLIANAVFVWTTDARLERQLAAIRAAGDPLTLAELARPPIPPEKNAETYLRRAQADIAAIEKETTDLHSVYEWPEILMPAEDKTILKASLAAHPNIIPLLEQAAACPDYIAELDYSLPPNEFMEQFLDYGMKTLRDAARVLRMRATLLIEEGNRDEAVRTALLNFRLARHFDRNPTLMSYLIAITVRVIAIHTANEALQTGPVSKVVRDALDAELAIQERMEGVVWAFISDRTFVPYYFDTFVQPPLPSRNFWFISRGYWNLQESAFLETFPTLIKLAKEKTTYRQLEQMFDVKNTVMTRWWFPPIIGVYRCVARTRAEIRCLRLLNALQTHVPAGDDEVSKLTELGLPIETTRDPFTGDLLHVKKTPRGWMVYSVGPNFQDDGGKLDDPLNGDVGIGPPPSAKPDKSGTE